MSLTTRILALCLALAFTPRAHAANPAVTDLFNRDTTNVGIPLYDWEGYMANPAIAFTIVPPPEAALPIQVAIEAPDPRLYFDLPSEATAAGPRKVITIQNAQAPTMSVGLAPARQKQKKQSALHITMRDARSHQWQLNVPLYFAFTEPEAATTKPSAKPATKAPETYPITIDFSQDKSGFFRDDKRKKLFTQAAQDWAFYFAPMQLNPVPAGQEKTWIWDISGFTKGTRISNAHEYTGYLMYAYGVSGPEKRSGGAPSGSGFQSFQNTKYPLRRSGDVAMEIKGNYNTLGYNFDLPDNDWFKATNLGDTVNDFYSIAHHEIGHALIFHPGYTNFPREGILHNDALRAYLGADPRLDKTDHLANIIDPASLHGGFGNEYNGKVPRGRWRITKLDLLVAQAVGYKLRDVDALTSLQIQPTTLPSIRLRQSFSFTFHAKGGIPFYDWSISAGALPPGLKLNRFTGELSGTPAQIGTSDFTIAVRDYTKNGAPATRQFSMTILHY